MTIADAISVRTRAPIRSERPAARAEVAVFPLDGELVLYDGRTGEAHMLNRTGVQIWRLCDGAHNVARIAREVAFMFGIPYRQALADVRDLVTMLDNADLVTFS